MPTALAILILLSQQSSTEKVAATPPKWQFHGESRYWFESRENYNLGKEPDLNTVLVRNRLSLELRPTSWLKVSGQMQDTRAPGYGRPRPGGVQDPFDLHEGYVEINPDIKRGWNFVAGRRRFFFGDQRFIGVPEWVNSGRTYDTAQVNYRWSDNTLHMMTVSQVNFDPTGFNVPRLRDRLTGVYFEGAQDYDIYFLRHSRIGQPATNSLGFRGAREFGKWKVSIEPVVQNAFGSVSYVQRKLGRLTSQLIHQYASPDFDQLYPAAHDRLGHGDIMIFRNVQSLQSLNKIALAKNHTLNLMYTAVWLADTSKPVYNFSSQPLPVPPGGHTSPFIGQEFAAFSVHRWGFFQLGFGYAQWKNGDPLKYAAPGKNLRYAYVHTGFSF